jgi:hypothetical protein
MKTEEESILECYEPALSALKERIIHKHKQYGTSFYERSHEWMEMRSFNEIIEYYRANGDSEKIHEAIDVTVCWLLIAQQYLAGKKKED